MQNSAIIVHLIAVLKTCTHTWKIEGLIWFYFESEGRQSLSCQNGSCSKLESNILFLVDEIHASDKDHL